MVDIFHLPYGSLLAHVGADSMTKFPNVKRWWEEISARPSWVAVAQGVKSTAAAK